MSFLPCPAPEPIPQHPIPSRPSAVGRTQGLGREGGIGFVYIKEARKEGACVRAQVPRCPRPMGCKPGLFLLLKIIVDGNVEGWIGWLDGLGLWIPGWEDRRKNRQLCMQALALMMWVQVYSSQYLELKLATSGLSRQSKYIVEKYKQSRFGLKVVRLDIGIEKSRNRKLRFAYGGKKKSLCPGLRMEGGEDKDEEEALRHGWDIGRM
ncbi:uncharacterized protein RSE6_09657 [Rhynchosporium secalis]|uniref:Uncharacterized protein n=1 Tax=Rhynchosporium secalis TaxID=38038 RepID=A0A1E1MIG1_RHYSE|nr:uncharacterized protein RSE6_09657 [Rhynchosporium secalis]